MINIQTPISKEAAESLQVGDRILLSGKIFCGRDAVLPKICQLVEEGRLGASSKSRRLC